MASPPDKAPPRDRVARKAISPTELAAQLGVSPASALRACRDGRVRCVRFGKRFLVPAGEADRLLAKSLPAGEAATAPAERVPAA